MDKNALTDAEIVWNYLVLVDPARSADLLLVLGSVDERVAVYAAELSRHYKYERVLVTGGKAHSHDLLRTTWQESEAEHFRDIFLRSGGQARKLLLETAAENTGQNAELSLHVLQKQNEPLPRTMEIVTKPYMTRRARATFDVQWPAKSTQYFFTAPPISFTDYVAKSHSFDTTTNVMVGDLQRIAEYPKCGFQSVQVIPKSVQEAYERLVAAGYNEHLIK